MAHYTDGMTDEQKKMIEEAKREVRSGKHGAKMMEKGFDPFVVGIKGEDSYAYLGLIHYGR